MHDLNESPHKDTSPNVCVFIAFKGDMHVETTSCHSFKSLFTKI